MKNRLIFFKITLYWLILIGAVIISLLLIEAFSDYRFDPQLGAAILIWGLVVSFALIFLAGVHNFILFMAKGVNDKENSTEDYIEN